ncbi:unnamed protein product [Agarophyton chilense]
MSTDSSASIDSDSLTLYDLLLPGTHDSAAYVIRPDLASRSTALPLRVRAIRTYLSTVQADFALTQKLTVYHQLQAGARFLDIRVSKRPPASDDGQFWTVHGMVLCVPLVDILRQINCFHQHTDSAHTVIIVFRAQFLHPSEEIQLAHFVRHTLKHTIFDGCEAQLRKVPFSELPPNVIAGLCGMPLSVEWGRDAWIDTYSCDRKISFLQSVLQAYKSRFCRNDLFVLGWTVTPSVWDVTIRVLSLGYFRPSVKSEAANMNARFDEFMNANSLALRQRCNVIFFDCFSRKLGTMVNSLNSLSQSSYPWHS